MLLEKQLLLNVESVKTAKRSRSSNTNDETTKTWIELARYGNKIET